MPVEIEPRHECFPPLLGTRLSGREPFGQSGHGPQSLIPIRPLEILGILFIPHQPVHPRIRNVNFDYIAAGFQESGDIFLERRHPQHSRTGSVYLKLSDIVHLTQIENDAPVRLQVGTRHIDAFLINRRAGEIFYFGVIPPAEIGQGIERAPEGLTAGFRDEHNVPSATQYPGVLVSNLRHGNFPIGCLMQRENDENGFVPAQRECERRSPFAPPPPVRLPDNPGIGIPNFGVPFSREGYGFLGRLPGVAHEKEIGLGRPSM